MIEVPENLAESVFNQSFEVDFQRGSVIKTLLVCHDEVERPHFFISLNSSPRDEPLLFFLTTSQLDFYNKHPGFIDIIRIQKETVAYFPLETVINCRKIYEFNKEKLRQNFLERNLIFVGILPEDLMKQIDAIVLQSRFISKIIKAKILGGEALGSAQTAPISHQNNGKKT